MLFAGLDVSTQSCKLVVIDLEKSELIYVDSVNYDRDLPEFATRNGVIVSEQTGFSESEPLMWIKSVEMVFENLKKSEIPQHEIKCISVSGQQHGLVALDKKGNLSRPTSKLWNDFSTQEECNLLTEKLGGLDEMISEVGNAQLTGYTAPKIFHMRRNEPENYDRTETFFLVHNYINWYLTGGIKAMEPGDTSGMALWHPGKHKWSTRVIEIIDKNLPDKLPVVQSSDRSIGFVSQEIAENFGFNPQCRVDAGSGDNMYGAIGTGNIEPGIVTVSLGTSGTAYTYLEEPFIDPFGEIAAFCDSTGHYLPLICVTNLANGYNALLQQFEISHREFSGIVQKTPPGNNGRLLIPWYEGERTPNVPRARPIYFGFGLEDFNIEILSRAVLEGHIQNLYNGFKRLPIEPTEIRLTGGLSQSEAWCQAIADVFNAETVPVEGEGAALGAALHAAWVWSNENAETRSLKEICRPFIKVRESSRKKPIQANRQVYDRQSTLFRELANTVCPGKSRIFEFGEKVAAASRSVKIADIQKERA